MTVQEFINIACAHYGCREETVRLWGETIHYLFRVDADGRPHTSILPEDRSGQLEQTTLESWCAQLGIHPEGFGTV